MESTGPAICDDRNVLLDACRLAAAVSIVWMHTWGYSDIPRIGETGRFGVPFFAASAMFLMTRGLMADPHRVFVPYAIRRFYRIYLPFLAWSIIGLVALDAHRILSHRPIVNPQPFHLYFGSTMQLWFLPFLLGISLALFFPVRGAAKQPWITAAIAVIAGIFCALYSQTGLNPGEPDTNWFAFVSFLQYSLFALPGIFWGIAAALLLGEKKYPLLGWIGLAVCLGCLCVVIRGPRNALMENLAGVGLLVFSLNAGQSAGRLGKYAFLAYGIYLCHAVFLEAIQGVLHRWSGAAGTSFIFLATLALNIACCLVLQRSPRTRWMLG